jgi:maltose alpha-D-glucosyltransferase/alpha-amylase
VFAAFGPEPEMQLYGRGIRRRLAPMLGNDRRCLELAYSLQFTLRGAPVLRYGEELGMGDELSLPDRNAIRTPMQWTDEPNAGFFTAPPSELVRPLISSGEYGYQNVNVKAQRQDPTSLLAWFERMIRTLRECPEVGCGSCVGIDVEAARYVLVHRADFAGGTVVFAYNLGTEDATLDLSQLAAGDLEPLEIFADEEYEPLDAKLDAVHVVGLGYRWIRLREMAVGQR